MENKLSEILGRKVNLRMPQDMEQVFQAGGHCGKKVREL
jgi:predicted nucleotidyltransferase